MLRAPSNQKQRDEFYSGDPAFAQLPPSSELDADALAKARTERERKFEVARETGDWSALLIDGAVPTKFVMRPIRSTTYRKLADAIAAGRIGLATAAQLAFRAALVSIENGGELLDAQVKRQQHAELGDLAHESVVDALDAIDIGIVSELGALAFRRAQAVPPKS